MKRFLVGAVALGLATGCFSVSMVEAADPELNATEPRGGQRGTTVDVELRGERLADAEGIVFYQPGISFEDLQVVPEKGGKILSVRFVIAPDAELGEHAFRVRTRSGLTYARRFWVSQFPTVKEEGENGAFESPQSIPMDVTVEGRLEPETIDYYVVEGKAGQRLRVELEGMRLTSAPRLELDPHVSILNRERFELAVSDDTSLLRQDAHVSLVLPADGHYVIAIRDAAYQGRGTYRAHVGSFPRPEALYPPGGKAGERMKVEFLGDVEGRYEKELTLPEGENEALAVFGDRDGVSPPSPNHLRVSLLDQVLEDEASNDDWQGMEAEAATVPCAFNGILSEPGDVDHFRFYARKDQTIRFRAYAKAIRSPVDPVLHVLNEKGRVLGGNDDANNSADSFYEFKAPEEGDYFLRVRDHLGAGGETHVYRVETEERPPRVEVTKPSFRNNDDQHRKVMVVPRGGRYASLVNVQRRYVRGDADLRVDGLPSGVKFHAGRLPANVGQFPVLFTAADDAPLGAALTRLTVVVRPEKGDEVTGVYRQTLDWVRGQGNEGMYHSGEADVLPVVVCEALPFRLELRAPDRPLIRDGQVNVKVVAKRDPKFTKPIRVRWLWKPPGVSCNAMVTIPEGKNEATFELSASGDAALETWKVCVQGESNAGSGTILSASDFVDLRVEDRFLTLDPGLTAVTRGEAADVVVKVTEARALPGPAKVELQGLPPHSQVEPVTLQPGESEVRFRVVTEAKAPVGQHKNLFCVASIEDGDAVRIQRGQRGVLRIDPRPKKPKAATNDAPRPKEDEGGKPLSRLEQLRREAENR